MKIETAIIINPAKQTIWLCELQPNKWYDLTKCGCPQYMNIHSNLRMSMDPFGLDEVCKKPAKAKRGFFVLLDRKGAPMRLFVGRGVIGAGESQGVGVPLPENFTPKYIAKYIRFIPPANYTEAVKLSAEILASYGKPNVYRDLMRRALALCDNCVTRRRIRNPALGWEGFKMVRSN